MNIHRFNFNPISENTWLVWDDTLEAAVIDAGNSNSPEDRELDEFVADNGLRVVLAIQTHGHFDHAMGVAHVVERYGARFAAHSGDAFLLDNIVSAAQFFGVTARSVPPVDVDLAGLSEIGFGNTVLRVLPTPGHTPGHVCLFEPVSRVVFTGDTLFADTIGRTDLPGGDYSWIMKSIFEQILPLGGDVRVLPGHGRDTTIGQELQSNPFITEVLDEGR